jgi:hypothetical protein
MKQDFSDTKNMKVHPDLSFLVDIMKHPNKLNLELWGRENLITSLHNNVEVFW